MMLYNKNIIMLKIINVFLSRLRKIMQPNDRNEIIFRNRFDKKMQKLFTAAQQLHKPKLICNKKYKNI